MIDGIVSRLEWTDRIEKWFKDGFELLFETSDNVLTQQYAEFISIGVIECVLSSHLGFL